MHMRGRREAHFEQVWINDLPRCLDPSFSGGPRSVATLISRTAKRALPFLVRQQAYLHVACSINHLLCNCEGEREGVV